MLQIVRQESGKRKMNKISVVLGSDSDIQIYREIADVLHELSIPYEKKILSAHRTPELLKEYVRTAEREGIQLFIAIAGMAAALPGAIASYSTLPVIGIPVALNSPLMGLDSLFSMLQMPPGVPVATVSVNGGRNAGLLAAEILALNDSRLKERLESFRKTQRERVVNKNRQFNEEEE